MQLGQSDGDQRLILAKEDLVVVGLVAQWSADRGISKLSILQTSPFGHASSQAEQFARLQAAGSYASSEIVSKLWKGQLPPPQINSLSDCKVGYWSLDFKEDLAPMEALVLGCDETGLSSIVESSCDVQLGAFQVQYSDGTSRTIGPRALTMKSLGIDGKGGERVVALYVAVSHITYSARLVTNRNRQLVIGPSPPGSESVRLHSLGHQEMLSGLYCNWSSHNTPKSRLETMGIMRSSTSPTPSTITSPTTAECKGQQDAGGLKWEPNHPPANWVESAPLYGQHEIPRAGSFSALTEVCPSHSATASRLDCSRPIDKVRLAVSHPSRCFSFSPVSIVLDYNDGTSTSVGPTRLTAPTDSEGENSSPWLLVLSRRRNLKIRPLKKPTLPLGRRMVSWW